MHNIDIEIAGRPYPVLVDEHEEFEVLEIVQHLNNQIADMHRRYGTKLNKQDILAMLLLTYAKKLKETEKNSNTEILTDKIDTLYLMLENALGGR